MAPADVTIQGAAEPRAALRAACEKARADDGLVLLEFSADWCIDCRTVASMSTRPDVAEARAAFAHVTVDVGRFDQNMDLARGFGVKALAWWVALEPADCSTPAESWPRRKQGSLEPASGSDGPRTAADLIAWLAAARAASQDDEAPTP